MTENRCPNCGAPLDARQIETGTCPSCLLELALASGDEDGEPGDPADTQGLDAGARVGPYIIERKIGEGGMGIVYLAQQVEPIRRPVALKIIKKGMDTAQVVARFEAERQALAWMDHPAIAKVFEAGETSRGRPYFAMEYIEGKPITEYCDERRLDTRQRLGLFAQVCDGIQHAHHRGIIHRDVKPSNVLVVDGDDGPAPRIIDFGVAKATEQRLIERSVFTELGVLVGTPEYMSPEQADMAPLDVDTRTDVYSLGVLMYELLTGALPFDSRELREAAFDEIRRKIREDQPSKPSTRISELGRSASGSASQRRTDVASLRRQLTGDLDVITMKALEKDRARRYGSPAELAADLERHLNDEPVLARPPSVVYQLQKLITRHKLPAAFAGLVLLLVVGFGIGMSVLYARAVRAEAKAAREAETAKQIAGFMTGVFEVSNPSEARGATVTARELLNQARARIDVELADQPDVQAEMLNTMGEVYRNLGLYKDAEPLLQGSHEAFRELYGDEDRRTLVSLSLIGDLYRRLGRWDDAERVLQEALEAQSRVFGAEARETLGTEGELASVYQRRGDFDKAETMKVDLLARARASLGNDDDLTLKFMNNLATLLRRIGRSEEAAALLEEAIENRRRIYGDDHPQTLFNLHNLVDVYRELNRYEDAEVVSKEVVESRTRVLGGTHPDTISSLNSAAVLYANWGRYEEAEGIFRRVIELQHEAGRADHPDTLLDVGNLAHLLGLMGRYSEAEPLLRQNLDDRKRVLGEDHPSTLKTMTNLGLVYLRLERYDEAEMLLRDALEHQRRVLGDEHRETRRTTQALIETLRGRGDEAGARRLEAQVSSSADR